MTHTPLATALALAAAWMTAGLSLGARPQQPPAPPPAPLPAYVVDHYAKLIQTRFTIRRPSGPAPSFKVTATTTSAIESGVRRYSGAVTIVAPDLTCAAPEAFGSDNWVLVPKDGDVHLPSGVYRATGLLVRTFPDGTEYGSGTLHDAKGAPADLFRLLKVF